MYLKLTEDGWIAQRLKDAVQRLPLPRPIPVLQQFLRVERSPFKHKTLGSEREITSHLAGFNFHCDLVLAIYGMEVCDAMFAEGLATWDDDAIVGRTASKDAAAN